MTADDELNFGSENIKRVVEKVMNVDQRNKLVAMLNYMWKNRQRRRQRMRDEQRKQLAIIPEDVEGETKKTKNGSGGLSVSRNGSVSLI